MIPGTCHRCGRPLEGATVLQRRYRKLRSGSAIGARGQLLRLQCECGHICTKQGTVVSLPMHTRGTA